jgi:RNA polymerase sigma-70 factor, ECF subfamily
VGKQLSATQLSQTDEFVVIALACTKDPDAFAEIVRRCQNRVRNFLRRLCKNSDQADDLAQSVFLKAWKSIHQLRVPSAFYGWLNKIMVSAWLEDIRSNRLDMTELDESMLVHAHNAASGERVDIDDALAQLPPPMRLCVVLAYNEGWSHQEIADTTNIPLGTVKSNIARGAAKLRILLSEYRKTN